jgi:hypothetical protein
MADAPFSLAWQSFHLPKQGHTAEEYEDAFAGRPAEGRFAVADGASESAFAGDWARLLVKAYVRVPGPWSAWLSGVRKRWRCQLEGRDLPWYAEAKIEEGAFAALLGIAFQPGHWRAEAVGDCCLFQVRGNRLRLAFPVSRSRDFTNQPHLLGSQRRRDAGPRTKRRRREGDWQSEDALYLMTDALAQWFLKAAEDRRRPWIALQDIQTSDYFAGWVEQLRGAGEVRNDDVTLIRIQEKSLVQGNGTGV